MIHLSKTGVSWLDLSGRYDPPTTIYNRYVRWGERGIWQRIFDALATEYEGSLAVIPSRSNAGIHIPHDPDIHAQRNLVERFFCRMKDMRRLTTGYEKLKRNFLSMVHIFAIRCWLN